MTAPELVRPDFVELFRQPEVGDFGDEIGGGPAKPQAAEGGALLPLAA